MRLSAWLVTLACVVCGCSVNLKSELEKTLPKPVANTLSPAIVPRESASVMSLSGSDKMIVERFNRVVDQIQNKVPGPLPNEIANEPVTRAFVAALGKAVVVPVGTTGLATIDWGLASPSLSASDGKKFALALRKVLNPERADAKTKARALQAGGQEFWIPLGQYLDAYVQGNYIDDLGGKIAKPKFNNGIGNDTIVGIETVFLEFLADWLLQTPLITDENGIYLNPEKVTPTAAVAKNRPTKKLSEVNLTEKQVRAMQCACSLAGDGGLALSGVLVRSFGGLNAGPVFVLGKLSFGDNQTASKVLETVFEVAFRNGIEAAVYSMLTRPTLYGAAASGDDYSCLLDLL
jgi:hypothetical protein